MLSVRLLTYVCALVVSYKIKLNEVGEISALLKYLVGSMSLLLKLVLAHLQSVNMPTEHNPNMYADATTLFIES